MKKCGRCGVEYDPYVKENKVNAVATVHLDTENEDNSEIIDVKELCPGCRLGFYDWLGGKD